MSAASLAADGPAKPLTIGEVLRLAVPLHAQRHRMPEHHWKTLRALTACRTAVLGGHTYRCADCGRDHFIPHSCRNRHCPSCQPMLGYDWMEKQAALLLPVPYFHIVFTLPHELNTIIAQNQAALYKLLFDSAATTLLEFGRHRFKAQLGITMVLHTWGQNLHEHYHMHCIVTGGGLTLDGTDFRQAKDHWLFPVKALSKVYRGKYRAGLLRLHEDKKLQFHGQLAAKAERPAFAALVSDACRQPWVVYAKRPFAGPQQVLAYLARYTHRVGISDRRLLSLDARSGAVTFSWKDYADGAKDKTMTLGAIEFVRRFRSHILPPRFVKIRHYGLLSNRNRQAKIAQCKALLPEAPKDTAGTASVNTAEPQLHKCPHCESTRLILVLTTRPPKRGTRHLPPEINDTS
jgi:DNA-directed RNA polymerase subunit RPC12/RpoP